MDEANANLIERSVDCAAALLFAASCAWCMGRLGAGVPGTMLATMTGGGATLALLRSVQPGRPRFALGGFATIDPPESPDELLLTDVVPIVVPEKEEEEENELLLSDALDDVDDQSRVVQLFDPESMPTPGELRARIDRHLSMDGRSAHPLPDASQALNEAIAELRRSLR